jgi:hypothetical protein
MDKLRKLWRKYKYSAESVYIFSELKNREKAREAMDFHEWKIIIQVSICVLVGQFLMLLALQLL